MTDKQTIKRLRQYVLDQDKVIGRLKEELEQVQQMHDLVRNQLGRLHNSTRPTKS